MPPTTTDDQQRRLRLTVSYDGTALWGAQVQPGRRTVGSELAGAFARITGEATRITFAGRTDRGVHAVGQVAHCDLASRMSDERLHRALNAVLPEDVAVLHLVTAPANFHARYDARWREYRYQLWNGAVRLPQLARTTWQLRHPLELAALNAGVTELVGEHDFAAFAGQGLGGPAPANRQAGSRRSTVRSVFFARWQQLALDWPGVSGQLVALQIRATGFLPQMVRTIVGAAVLVGTGEREPAWLAAVLNGRDRAAAPAPAPPQGLTFWRVGYGDEE